MHFRLLLLFLAFKTISAHGQNFYSGIIPEVTLSYKVSDNVKLTSKVESMHTMYSGVTENGSEWDYDYQRTDFQLFSALKLNPYWEVAAGYQLRLTNDGRKVHRSIQQVTFVQRRYGYRLGHWFRFDQTYFESLNTEYRLRYRLSSEFPLSGESIEPREYYLILSEEPIFSFQGNDNEFENRLTGSVGYYFNLKHKVESGLDYRTDRFVSGDIRHRLWVKFSWFVNL